MPPAHIFFAALAGALTLGVPSSARAGQDSVEFILVAPVDAAITIGSVVTAVGTGLSLEARLPSRNWRIASYTFASMQLVMGIVNAVNLGTIREQHLIYGPLFGHDIGLAATNFALAGYSSYKASRRTSFAFAPGEGTGNHSYVLLPAPIRMRDAAGRSCPAFGVVGEF